MRFLLMICVFGLVVFTGGNALARVFVETSLHLRGEATDNVFLVPDREDSDFITTLEPALVLGLDTRRLAGDIRYGLSLVKYLDHENEDETALKDIQRGAVNLTLLPGEALSFIGEGTIDRVTIDERGVQSTRPTRTNRTTRYQASVGPSLRYRVSSSLSLIGDYRYQVEEFVDPAGDDRTGQVVSLMVYKRFSDRFACSLTGRGEWQNLDFTSDYDAQTLHAGIEAKPMRLVELNVRGGATRIELDGRDDTTSTTGDGKLLIGDGNPWLLTLAGRQSYSNSVDEGVKKHRVIEASIGRSGRLHGSVTLFQNRDAFEEIVREDKVRGIRGEIALDIGKSVTVKVKGLYQYQEYQPDNEKGHRYDVGPELAWTRRWLTLAVGYHHNANRSNLPVNDYRESVVYLDVRLNWGTKRPETGGGN
ncbi:MAG: hypothetical protein Tsb0017_06310 [Geothermobacteraceae bacterium]